MPEEYEVHGPHDHAVEHAVHGHSGHSAHGGEPSADPLPGRIAVMTAVLATVGAILSYQSGTTENLALYYKNEAAIRKTEAANQWAYYQAKGEKQNLAELGAALAPADSPARAKFDADVKKYRDQKEPIRTQAEALEKEVERNDAAAETQLHRHHRWAQATTLIQISIALAAITLLTRRNWLQGVTIAAAVAGIATGVAAALAL